MKKSEFGRAFIEQKRKSKFLDGWFDSKVEEVWMSHGDHVSEMAPDFKVLATSKNSPFAMVADEKRNFMVFNFILRLIILQKEKFYSIIF